MAYQSTPETARQDFVRLLGQARRKLAVNVGDGSIRALAREIKVSPSRAADWTRQRWFLTIEDESDPRLRKAVAGFASSVHRALSWLKLNGFARAVEDLPGLEDILAGYWPEDRRDLLSRPVIATGIADGRIAVDPHPSVTRMRIEVRIVPWDAFTHWDPDTGEAQPNERTGFFWSYADAVFKSVDPLDSDLVPREVAFHDALDLPPPSQPNEKILSLGLYDTLYRRFRGGDFIGIPLFRMPLVGLEIGTGSLPEKIPIFEKAFGRDLPCPTYAIEHQVAHIYLRSIARDRDQVLPIAEFREAKDIADALVEHLEGRRPGESIMFLSDSTIALGVYARLLKFRDVAVRPIPQRNPRELSYPISFMLRADDDGFHRLVSEAQAVLMQTPWRVIGLLNRLADGVDSWAEKSGAVRQAVTGWTPPVFLFDEDDLLQAGLLPRAVRRLARAVREWAEKKEKGDQIIGQLWADVDDLDRQDDPHQRRTS